jgi:hypothetical protein
LNKNKYLITFKKPYNFEGTEYKDVDLSALEDLKTKDLIQADTTFVSTGNAAVMNEMSIGYNCLLASKATDKPIEFFENLPCGEGIKVKTIVQGFLYSVE